MTESLEVRLLAVETSISLDGALAVAEQIASHGIIESSSFEHLMTLLEEAASAVDQIRRLVEREEDPAAKSGSVAPSCDRGQTALQLISGVSHLVRPKPGGLPALRLIASQER